MTSPRQPGFRNPLGQGRWYYLLVAASIGFLAPLAFAHAASRLRSAVTWGWAVLYLAMMVAVMTFNSAELDAEQAGRPTTGLGGVLIIGYIVLALVHLTYLRRRIWPREPRPAQDPAVTAALAARARRQEARRIVETDRPLAHELRIGRPDLPRTFDDGGLVDLNVCSAEMIARYCDIDLVVAQRIVDSRRAAAAPFATLDDVFTFTDIPLQMWERIRDRGIVIADTI